MVVFNLVIFVFVFEKLLLKRIRQTCDFVVDAVCFLKERPIARDLCIGPFYFSDRILFYSPEFHPQV